MSDIVSQNFKFVMLFLKLNDFSSMFPDWIILLYCPAYHEVWLIEHCGVWLCGVMHTAEFDFVGSCTVHTAHCRVWLCRGPAHRRVWLLGVLHTTDFYFAGSCTLHTTEFYFAGSCTQWWLTFQCSAHHEVDYALSCTPQSLTFHVLHTA